NPDGLTFLVNTSAFVTAPAIEPNLPFDPREDLVPVSNLGYVSFMLVTNGNAELDSFDEIIEDSKTNPVFAATSGLGATNHFAMEKIKAKTGAGFDMVHYKGGVQAALATLRGEAQLYIASVLSVKEYLAAGTIKPVTILCNERIDTLPDV